MKPLSPKGVFLIQKPPIMQPNFTEEKKKRKVTFTDVIKTIVGFGLIASLLWTVNFMAGMKKTNADDAGITHDKEGIKLWPEPVYIYQKGNITYLVFCNENSNGLSLAIQNYTADSLRMVEYLDFEASIKDTCSLIDTDTHWKLGGTLLTTSSLPSWNLPAELKRKSHE